MQNPQGSGLSALRFGLSRLLAPALLALSLLLPIGCVAKTDADAARPLRSQNAREVTFPWPSRGTADRSTLQARVSSLGENVTVLRRGVRREDADLIPDDILVTRRLLGASIVGMGAVVETLPLPDARLADSIVAQRVSSLTFLSENSPDGERDPATGDAPATDQPPAIFGEQFALYMPTAQSAESEIRGIVVQLHGLGGVEYEQPVIDALRSRGYAVLVGDFPWSKWRASKLDLQTDEDLFNAARQLGSMVDECLAESAYAVEAVVRYLDSTRPELRGRPIVLAGFSVGSLATPTIAARLAQMMPERLAAVLLVGAGSNLIYIAQSSELTHGGIRVMSFGEPVTGPRAALLAGAYIKYTRLDPIHTSAALRPFPTLLIMGSSDTIVPSIGGEELWQRADRPDRWLVRGGHRTVFLQLSMLADDIADWIDKKVSVHATGATNGKSVTPAAPTPRGSPSSPTP